MGTAGTGGGVVADGQLVQGSPQDGVRGPHEVGGVSKAADGGLGQDQHAARCK